MLGHKTKEHRAQSGGFTDNLFPLSLPFLPIILPRQARWGRGKQRPEKGGVVRGASLRTLKPPSVLRTKSDQTPKLRPRGSLQDHSQATLWLFLFNGSKAHKSLPQVLTTSPTRLPNPDGPDGKPETGFIICHPSTPRAIPVVNRFSPESKVGRSFTPFAAPALSSISCVARRSQRSLRAESWSRSRSRSWSQSREDRDKAEKLGSAAAVASEVAVMMSSEAAGPNDTYPAGARLGRARTEGGVGSKSRPQPERSWAGCGSLRAPAASAAAPRRPPAPKEGARRRLHPPSPAPCTPPSLCFPLGYLSAPAVRRWGWRPRR